MQKNNIVRDCYLYEYINVHLRLPQCETLKSNKSKKNTLNINCLIAMHLSMLSHSVIFALGNVKKSGILIMFFTWENAFYKLIEHNL